MPELAVPGARLFYRERGEGPLLVFLHGVGSSSHTWEGQLKAFGDGFHCVAPDMRGYAASSLDDVASISMARFALDVAELIAALGGPAHVCGLSMGGIVALQLWRQRPDLVRSLALCDTWANHPVAAAAQPSRLAAIDAASMPELAEARMPAVYAPSAPAPLVRVGVDMFATLDKAAYRAASADLWTQDLRDVARSVTVPALVMVGEDDTITPPALSEELASLIPGGELVVIPGAGHLTNEENPSAFNSALERFLST